MRKSIKTALIIFTIVLLTSLGFAEEKPSWEEEFTLSLQKAKVINNQITGGLGYSVSQEEAEEEALKNAIQKAMDAKADPCQAMTIAYDLKYKAHSIIKNIFGSGGKLLLDDLCMCATNTGVTKAVFTAAATEAMSGGKAVFLPDEVTEATCGLGYTPEEGLEEVKYDYKPPESGESVDLGTPPIVEIQIDRTNDA